MQRIFFFGQNKKALPLITYLDFKDTKNKAQNSLKWTKPNFSIY